MKTISLAVLPGNFIFAQQKRVTLSLTRFVEAPAVKFASVALLAALSCAADTYPRQPGIDRSITFSG
jgi:hypothetical protein